MTASELRARFEDLTLPAGDFHHEQHVQLAWTYLRELPLLDVLRVFPENLRRFATSLGAAGKYNETVTWAFLLLVAGRMASGNAESWPAFAAANPDLLSKELLHRYYDPATLDSDLARETFVFPRPSDRV